MEKAKYIRFVKDYNLPINIFDKEHIDYYRELYKDFWPVEAENQMNQEIESFDGNVQKWLEHYGQFRDTIINTLENSKDYLGFNNGSMSYFDIPNIGLGEKSLYTEETDGGLFLSIDLCKANFQALKYVGVIKNDTYEDFIKSFGGSEYFTKSKYLRQVIFGKLNPKRQIKVEKYLIWKILSLLSYNGKLQLYSYNSDEIVYKILNLSDILKNGDLEGIKTMAKQDLGIDIKAEVVQIKRLPIINSNGNKVDAYIRRNIYTGEEKLKKVSTTFFPQIWKLYKGMEINEMDRHFFFEDQIATFNNPLILIKNEN